MKVKKYIGKSINGFIIKDTYVKITPNNKKARKVLLECEDCGRLFERCSGVDFNHVKCKCKCEYLKPKPEKYHWIEWQGVRYTMTDFCNKYGLNIGTFRSRIEQGLTVEQAMKDKREIQCLECHKWFLAGKNEKYCSDLCRHRHNKKRKPRQVEIGGCVVCHKLFIKVNNNQITCSKECRRDLAQIDRNERYKDLKARGEFDYSVTLRNVYKSFNGICQHCHKELSFESDVCGDDYPSIDHIIPISKGGTHTWDNVQLLCRRCNYMKSDKILEVTQ